MLPSATPNYPSYISVWALTLSNTSSPMSTHTQTQADAYAHTHTLFHLPAVLMHCPRTMCTLAKTFKSRRVKHTHNGHRSLFLVVVLSIFSSFAFIFGPFCISWRVFASIFSHFVNHSSVFFMLILISFFLHLFLTVLHLYVKYKHPCGHFPSPSSHVTLVCGCCLPLVGHFCFFFGCLASNTYRFDLSVAR